MVLFALHRLNYTLKTEIVANIIYFYNCYVYFLKCFRSCFNNILIWLLDKENQESLLFFHKQ